MSVTNKKKKYPLAEEDVDGATLAPLDTSQAFVEIHDRNLTRSCSDQIENTGKYYPLTEDDEDGATLLPFADSEAYKFATISDEDISEEVMHQDIIDEFKQNYTTSTPNVVSYYEEVDVDDTVLLTQSYPTSIDDENVGNHLVQLNRQGSYSPFRLQEEVSCGVGSFHPSWLQRFASRKWYLVVYSYLGVVQAMYYTYFLAVLSTIEKRFGIPSSITGLIMSGNEVSQILFSLFLAYFGGRGNRPQWIAIGMGCTCFAMLLLCFPHFIYGSGVDVMTVNRTHPDTQYEDLSRLTLQSLCRSDQVEPECEDKSTKGAVLIIYLAMILQGAGSVCFYSLGLPYLDDNSEASSAPIYLGLATGIRFFGPFLGFLLGYLCLRVFISPHMDVTIDYEDAQWMGAWWLGFILIGVLLLIGTLFIALFPIRLPNEDERKGHFIFREDNKQIPPYYQNHLQRTMPSIKELPRNIVELLKNPIVSAYLGNGVFGLLGIIGFFTFLPKYLESQFMITAAEASIYTGLSVVIGPAIAYIGAGFLLHNMKPSARKVTGWNVILAGLQVSAVIVIMFFSCSSVHMQGEKTLDHKLNLSHGCNTICECNTHYFNPVCDLETKISYYSPCYAGCDKAWYKPSKSAAEKQNSLAILREFFEKVRGGSSDELYTGCSCLADPDNLKTPADPKSKDTGSILETIFHYLGGGGNDDSKKKLKYKYNEVVTGFCTGECSQLVGYVVTLAVVIAVAATGKVGTLLVLLRSVDPKDKAMVLGVFTFVLSLLAFIPSSILFGTIIDASCLVWKESCGEETNCSIYDTKKFRYSFHGTVIAFLSVAAVFDVIVFFKARFMQLYEVSDRKSFELTPVKEDEPEDLNL